MIKKFAPVLAAAALAPTLLFAVPASAATSHNFAACSRRGNFATCQATGSVRSPIRLFLHVRAQPQQNVTVDWAVVCRLGSKTAQRSGTFSADAQPTITRKMAMPYKHPTLCGASVKAGLSTRGTSIHVWLTAVR